MGRREAHCSTLSRSAHRLDGSVQLSSCPTSKLLLEEERVKSICRTENTV